LKYQVNLNHVVAYRNFTRHSITHNNTTQQYVYPQLPIAVSCAPIRKYKIGDSSLTTLLEMPQSKEQKIDEAKANLPLPEDPPVASDWQSADARNVNVGSGGVQAPIGTGVGASAGLREPASTDAQDLSNVGRQGVEGLSHPPKDAAAK
jgi:hypothetical protein